MSLIGAGKSFANEIFYPVSKTNSYKVYLSPAYHSPDKTDCNSFSENYNSKEIARQSALDLRSMGYTVRLGTGSPSANITNSNNWNTDFHVPVHTNAKSTFDCSSTNEKNGGTVTMYAANKSSTPATKILDAMRSSSPGTGDTYFADTGSAPGYLGELRDTNRMSAYIEVGYHTYGKDVTWLLNHNLAGQAVTNGIHNATGTADCRTQACIITNSIEPTEEIADSIMNVMKEEKTFDLSEYGEIYGDLERDLTSLMSGEKADTVIADAMKDTVIGVSIDKNGTVVVSFKDFREFVAAPSSDTRGEFLWDLHDTVFKYPEVKEVYFTFDGNFTEWLELTDDPIIKHR